MTTTYHRRLLLLAGIGSAGLLGGALFFQYAVGLAPCEICIWQRIPHVIVIALVLGSFARPSFQPAGISATVCFTLLISAGLGFFHVGIEQDWWKGITECAAPATVISDPREMAGALAAKPLVRCDIVPWALFGGSMASYNALLSLILSGLAALATFYRIWR